MNNNQQVIEEFYAAFAAHNAHTMASCYHPDVVFQDPVFGVLRGQDAVDMWQMLVDRGKGQLTVTFSEIAANGNHGTARWEARYLFGATQRQVTNRVHATFEFHEGLIIRHTDRFDLWAWSRQALGWKGALLGWTGFMQKRVHQQALQALRRYQHNRS